MKEILVILTFLISTSALALPGIPTSNDLSSGLYNSLVKNQYHSKCIEVSNTKSALQDLFNYGEKLDCSENIEEAKFCSCLSKISKKRGPQQQRELDIFNEHLSSLIKKQKIEQYKLKYESCLLIEKGYGSAYGTDPGFCSKIITPSSNMSPEILNKLSKISKKVTLPFKEDILFADAEFLKKFQEYASTLDIKGNFHNDKNKLKEIYQRFADSPQTTKFKNSPLYKIFTSDPTSPGEIIYETILELSNYEIYTDKNNINSNYTKAIRAAANPFNFESSIPLTSHLYDIDSYIKHSKDAQKELDQVNSQTNIWPSSKELINPASPLSVGTYKAESFAYAPASGTIDLAPFKVDELFDRKFQNTNFGETSMFPKSSKVDKSALASIRGKIGYGANKQLASNISSYLQNKEDTLDYTIFSNKLSSNDIIDLAKNRDELYSYLSKEQKEEMGLNNESSKELFNLKFDQYYCERKNSSPSFKTNIAILDSEIGAAERKRIESEKAQLEDSMEIIDKTTDNINRSISREESLNKKKSAIVFNLAMKKHSLSAAIKKLEENKFTLKSQARKEQISELEYEIELDKEAIRSIDIQIAQTKKEKRDETIILTQQKVKAEKSQSALKKIIQNHNNKKISEIYSASSLHTKKLIDSATDFINDNSADKDTLESEVITEDTNTDPLSTKVAHKQMTGTDASINPTQEASVGTIDGNYEQKPLINSEAKRKATNTSTSYNSKDYSLLQNKINSLRSDFDIDTKNQQEKLAKTKKDSTLKSVPKIESEILPDLLPTTTVPPLVTREPVIQAPLNFTSSESLKSTITPTQRTISTVVKPFNKATSEKPTSLNSKQTESSDKKSNSTVDTKTSSTPLGVKTSRDITSKDRKFSLSELEPVTVTDDQEVLSLDVAFKDLSPTEQQAYLEKLLDESDKESLLIELSEGRVVKFKKKPLTKPAKIMPNDPTRVQGLNNILTKGSH